VHDYKDTASGGGGASTPDMDNLARMRFEPAQFRALLDQHPLARALFDKDMNALRSCDACVMVLPCGRSAHLELGYAVGAGKRTIALLQGECEPDLMYKMVDRLCVSIDEVLQALREWEQREASQALLRSGGAGNSGAREQLGWLPACAPHAPASPSCSPS
jgi:hypothetical protein